MANTKARGNKGEKEVSTIINTDASYYHSLDNVVLVGGSGMTHQIDHIVIRCNGVFCIETKNIPGEISGSIIDNSWVQKVYQNGKPVYRQFHNPLKQNDSHRKILQRYLGDKYLYIPLVVFASNNISKLHIPDVIDLKDLNEYISTYDTGVNYSKRQIDAIYKKLLECKSSISEKDHLQNIQNQKQENKINKAIMIECLKQKICPKCGCPLDFHGAFYACTSRRCNYKIAKENYDSFVK